MYLYTVFEFKFDYIKCTYTSFNCNTVYTCYRLCSSEEIIDRGFIHLVKASVKHFFLSVKHFLANVFCLETTL